MTSPKLNFCLRTIITFFKFNHYTVTQLNSFLISGHHLFGSQSMMSWWTKFSVHCKSWPCVLQPYLFVNYYGNMTINLSSRGNTEILIFSMMATLSTKNENNWGSSFLNSVTCQQKF